MNTLDQISPIQILTARVNNLEAATRQLEAARMELHAKMAMLMEIKSIPETKQLKISESVKMEGNSPDAVDKRYRIWQVLYENGYTVSSIARAWKTDRGAIQHAKKQGWRSRYLSK